MTELTWDGKYKDGKKQGPVRIALPFQTVETVNESAQDRHRNLELFSAGRETEWRNRLIWGDKKYVLPSLLPEFAGKVNLIYIDPPFATGADFSFTATIPESNESFTKEPSMIEQKAYRDTWGRGLDSYLQSGGRQENRYSRKHDIIYLYNRSDKWVFNSDSIGEPRGNIQRNNMKREVDEEGRVYFSIKSAGKIYKYY